MILKFIKTKILILFLALAVLPPMLAKAQINYAVSGNTAYVTNSPNASGSIVIASTYEGHPVTSIGVAAFSGRTNLTSVTIPNSVTNVGQGAFFHCSHLTSVLIPNSVTGIGGSAFQNCTSLTSVTIPNSVTSIGIQAFLGTSLTNITVDATNPDYSSLNGVLFDKTQTTLITFPGGLVGSYVIPNSVTNIGYFAFSVTSLTNVTIPNSVTSIGEEAFSGCIPLTSVTIPNSVTNIGYFAFQGCFTLATIVIPDSVTSIGVEAFYNCISLTSVTIPNSVTSIGDAAFQNCNKLISVMIGNSVTNIGIQAFLVCTSLTNIIVDAANPAYSSLNGVLFDKTQTTLIEFPEGLGGSYIIPNSVTSIGDIAFQDCTSLTNVTIPNNVTSIGDFAFDDCRSLTNLTFLGNAPDLGSDVFDIPSTKVYYYAGMKGWGAKYDGLSTVKLGEPTLSIVAPKANQRWSNSVFTVTGTVQNNAGLAGVGLAGVFYSLNNDAWTSATTANGWSNWTATVTLTPGTNTIAVYAEDTEGITSTTNTVKFIYVLTAPLTVNLNGDGTVSPNYNNELLEIGTSYSMTAKAATGFGFAGWTGSETTNGATLKFVMASNLTFTANFVDTTKPTLSIVSPKANAKLTNVVLAVTGTAKDNAELAGVFYSLNNGAWAKVATANGWSNWTATVTLTQKTNTIAAYAQDAAGNVSTTNTVKFTLIVTPPSSPPQIGSGTAGVQAGGKFGFAITGVSSQTIVVEASTNLVDWQPVWTNTLSGASTNFTDSQWKNFPNRYYRAR